MDKMSEDKEYDQKMEEVEEKMSHGGTEIEGKAMWKEGSV